MLFEELIRAANLAREVRLCVTFRIKNTDF